MGSFLVYHSLLFLKTKRIAQKMASLFGSPPSLSHPITRTHHFSSSQQSPPPPQPPPTPSQSPPPLPSQPLSTTTTETPTPVSAKVQRQKPAKAATSSSAESTDWIASTLTRRFGLGAGLAWAAFLAFGVVSEQIKTRLEVSQQEANTRFFCFCFC